MQRSRRYRRWGGDPHTGTAGLIVALCVALISPALAQRKPPAKPAPIYAPVNEEVELKSVRRGEKARFEFTIRNKGSAPLTIDVVPTCNCTVPSYDRVIQPGKTGKVVAELATLDLSGYVTKTLLITTNDPKRPRAGLYMIATIASMVEVLPTDRVVMRLGDEQNASQELTLRLQPGETAEITGVRSNMRFLQATLKPMDAPPGTGREYRLILTVLPSAPLGRSQARVTLTTTSPVESEIRVAVTCEKGIVATPASLYLGLIGSKLKEPIERQISLVKHGSTFDVRNVTCDDPGVRVSYTTIRRGEHYRVHVRYSGGWSPGWVQRRIFVETDDPRQPRIVIPLTARVSDRP